MMSRLILFPLREYQLYAILLLEGGVEAAVCQPSLNNKVGIIDRHPHDPGYGILDLDVHDVEDRRAWRHRLHHSQKAKPNLPPLVIGDTIPTVFIIDRYIALWVYPH